jgi:hypothetical protein
MISIQSTISILTRLSATATLSDTIDLVRQKALMAYSIALKVFLQPFPSAKAIHAGLAILLVVCAFFLGHTRISL